MPKEKDDVVASKAPKQTWAAQRPSAPPPKPMVTASDRAEQREARRVTVPPRAANMAPVNVPAGANEALQAEVTRFNDLQGKVLLAQINDDVEDIETAINALPANLENIRARGYVFKSYLEKKIETLATQWRDLRPRVVAAIPPQQRTLQTAADQVQATLNRGALAGSALTTLESKVNAAISNLEGMYNTLDGNVNQTQHQIDDISWTLQQAEQASFGFVATECPVEAVPANWKKEGDSDGVEGVLFLTDQRLIFEQKEEVATKKVLFITTEKKIVQALQWEVPVTYIEKAVGSNRGFMGKDDFLTLHGTSQAPFRTTDLHLKGESGESWQGFIGRVKSGEIAKERTVPVDQATVDTVANAPTKCSTCGATFTQTILRGQTEITCEFCGSKMRL